MDIIHESVRKIKELLDHGGCGDEVVLDVNPDSVNCRFERGACMRASFGGRTADFVTFDPIRARTRISFMYDAPMDTPATRGGAAAIANVVTGFFCLSRILHSCPEECHRACLRDLVSAIGNRPVFCAGEIANLGNGFSFVRDPAAADIILIGCEGLVTAGTGDLIEKYRGNKRILFIGSSTAGIARLHELEHWCPYGRSSV